ncbi:MAG: hypothetical protein ABI813_00355 [Bacteroidota bacterium]
MDANNGWVTGQSLLRTRDGGASWQKIQNAATNDVQFFDANNGYITTYDGKVYRTSDGGVTLQPLNDIAAHAIFFLNPNQEWLTGSYQFKPLNGGASFTAIGGGLNRSTMPSSLPIHCMDG